MVKTRAKTNTEGPRGLNYNPSNIIQRVGDEQDNLAIRGGEFLDRDGVVGATIESTGMIGTSMDVMAKSGNFSAEQTAILENNVNEGAYWGNVTDVIEVYSAAAAAFKNREPADLAQLTLSVGRFATGVVDTYNTLNAGVFIIEPLNVVVIIYKSQFVSRTDSFTKNDSFKTHLKVSFDMVGMNYREIFNNK